MVRITDDLVRWTESTTCPDSCVSVCRSVLNAMNHKGYSPAHVAGSVGVMQTLYEYGADVFLTTPNNRTPLFTAAAKVRLHTAFLSVG